MNKRRKLYTYEPKRAVMNKHQKVFYSVGVMTVSYYAGNILKSAVNTLVSELKKNSRIKL